MASQSYTYELKGGKDVYGLVSAINNYLSDTEKMETQRVTGEGEGYIALQARVKGGNWKQIIGMDKAITIRFIKKSGNSVCMEIGEAKWVDKGGIMLLSMFVLWPLTITSGIGMYKQGSLPGKIRNVADDYMGVTAKEVEAKASAKAARDRELENFVTRMSPAVPRIMDALSRMIR